VLLDAKPGLNLTVTQPDERELDALSLALRNLSGAIAVTLLEAGARPGEMHCKIALENMEYLLENLLLVSHLLNSSYDFKGDDCQGNRACLLHHTLNRRYVLSCYVHTFYLAMHGLNLTKKCFLDLGLGPRPISLIESQYSSDAASVVLINAYQNSQAVNPEFLKGIMRDSESGYFYRELSSKSLKFSERLNQYVTADLIVRKIFLPLFYRLEENHEAKQFSELDPQYQVVLTILYDVISYSETSFSALLGWIYFQQCAGPQLFATEVINLIVGEASPIYNYCRTFDPDAVQYGITLKQAHTIVLRLFEAYLTLASAQAVYPEFFQEQETKSLLKQEVEGNKPISFVNYLAIVQVPKLEKEAAELTPEILKYYALR
jgi:hypothetical protein